MTVSGSSGSSSPLFILSTRSSIRGSRRRWKASVSASSFFTRGIHVVTGMPSTMDSPMMLEPRDVSSLHTSVCLVGGWGGGMSGRADGSSAEVAEQKGK